MSAVPSSANSIKRKFDSADLEFDTFKEHSRNKKARIDANLPAPLPETFTYKKNIETIDDELICKFLKESNTQIEQDKKFTSNRIIEKLLSFNPFVKKINATVFLFDPSFLTTLNRCGGSIVSLTLRIDHFSNIKEISLPGLHALRELVLNSKNGLLPPVSQATITKMTKNIAIANGINQESSRSDSIDDPDFQIDKKFLDTTSEPDPMDLDPHK
jgi:hypothetical protein